jgi:hypothetical protein
MKSYFELRESLKAEKAKEKEEGYVSAAQRKAVWANKADGGRGHPDKKRKGKK